MNESRRYEDDQRRRSSRNEGQFGQSEQWRDQGDGRYSASDRNRGRQDWDREDDRSYRGSRESYSGNGGDSWNRGADGGYRGGAREGRFAGGFDSDRWMDSTQAGPGYGYAQEPWGEDEGYRQSGGGRGMGGSQMGWSGNRGNEDFRGGNYRGLRGAGQEGWGQGGSQRWNDYGRGSRSESDFRGGSGYSGEYGNSGGREYGVNQNNWGGSSQERFGQGNQGGQRWGQSSNRGYEGSMGRQSWGQSEESRGYMGKGPKGYQRSDERIREEISDALTDDPSIDASEIEVQVKSGEVTLTGTVADRNQKRRAEDLAESMSGVSDVTNNIRVTKGDQSQSGQRTNGSGTSSQGQNLNQNQQTQSGQTKKGSSTTM